MNDERAQSQLQSRLESRLSTGSRRYFDFCDPSHSVFSRNSYYDDKPTIHPWSRRPCSRHSGIPFTTLRATSCSPRLDELCVPKIKCERLIRQEFFDNFRNYAYSTVSSAALNAQCSDRLQRLAKSKPTPHGYEEAYTLPRSVSAQALNVQISDRLSQLSKPRRNVLLLRAAWKNKQK